jgi:phosphate:Na+ symporter
MASVCSAARVVGAAVGTTLTGALVAVGGTIHAKRTALAYILFNAVAGAIAIALLPAFLWAIDWLGRHAGLDAGATSLAAFHTLFIGVGVVLFLPFVPRFARLVERLLPEQGQASTQRLDASLLSIPAVALEASQRALEQLSLNLLGVYGDMLRGQASGTHEVRLNEAAPSLNDTYDFVSRIELPADDAVAAAQRVAQLHAIDHLLRLRARLQELAQARIDLSAPAYHWALEHSQQILQGARQGLEQQDVQGELASLALHARTLAELSNGMRNSALKETLPGPNGPLPLSLQRIDSYRWIERTANHIWRICHYLSQGRSAEALPDEPASPV